MNKVKRKLETISIAVLAVLSVLVMANGASAASTYAYNLEQCHNADKGNFADGCGTKLLDNPLI